MFAIEITNINTTFDVVYYESRKGELKIRLMNEERSTIEKSTNVMGEHTIQTRLKQKSETQ